ncbi:hypothetical protein COLO4_09246 [Corchorus olitorius]|uniref:Uncharacterized protein n=1 Tax=Corchorus olitorius TaxID=93759 RepID=A0A1R3KCU6_9ROSI|nr:hypothetical protein COLO4_09246 [Corchorus olitorius]
MAQGCHRHDLPLTTSCASHSLAKTSTLCSSRALLSVAYSYACS